MSARRLLQDTEMDQSSSGDGLWEQPGDLTEDLSLLDSSGDLSDSAVSAHSSTEHQSADSGGA